MNIQELGSLGEFVGAFAVLATLIYLSIQTRLTRKAAEETAKFSSQQMTQGVNSMYSKWRQPLLNIELAELMVKARGSENLTEAEQVIFSTAFEELFFNALVSYESAIESASFHDAIVDEIYLLGIMEANPRSISEWQRLRPALTAGSARYVKAIDSLLETRGLTKQND